jgi:hypothetical protein
MFIMLSMMTCGEEMRNCDVPRTARPTNLKVCRVRRIPTPGASDDGTVAIRQVKAERLDYVLGRDIERVPEKKSVSSVAS